MSKTADRKSIAERLGLYSRPRAPDDAAGEARQPRRTTYPIPPSRANKKSMTTWQDELALQLLKDISHEKGISQQALIAEGINYVLAKHGKAAVAT